MTIGVCNQSINVLCKQTYEFRLIVLNEFSDGLDLISIDLSFGKSSLDKSIYMSPETQLCTTKQLDLLLQ